MLSLMGLLRGRKHYESQAIPCLSWALQLRDLAQNCVGPNAGPTSSKEDGAEGHRGLCQPSLPNRFIPGNLITMVTEASCEEKTNPQTGIFRVSVQMRSSLRMCVYVCKCAYVFCNVSMCMYMCTSVPVYMCALVSEQVYVCMLVHKTSLASGALSISY